MTDITAVPVSRGGGTASWDPALTRPLWETQQVLALPRALSATGEAHRKGMEGAGSWPPGLSLCPAPPPPGSLFSSSVRWDTVAAPVPLCWVAAFTRLAWWAPHTAWGRAGAKGPGRWPAPHSWPRSRACIPVPVLACCHVTSAGPSRLHWGTLSPMCGGHLSLPGRGGGQCQSIAGAHLPWCLSGGLAHSDRGPQAS